MFADRIGLSIAATMSLDSGGSTPGPFLAPAEVEAPPPRPRAPSLHFIVVILMVLQLAATALIAAYSQPKKRDEPAPYRVRMTMPVSMAEIDGLFAQFTGMYNEERLDDLYEALAPITRMRLGRAKVLSIVRGSRSRFGRVERGAYLGMYFDPQEETFYFLWQVHYEKPDTDGSHVGVFSLKLLDASDRVLISGISINYSTHQEAPDP